jgi:hypothetical protein
MSVLSGRISRQRDLVVFKNNMKGDLQNVIHGRVLDHRIPHAWLITDDPYTTLPQRAHLFIPDICSPFANALLPAFFCWAPSKRDGIAILVWMSWSKRARTKVILI